MDLFDCRRSKLSGHAPKATTCSSGAPIPASSQPIDQHAAKLQVSIEDVSRMRKLKKTEDERVIGGADYATRLKEHYVTAM